jgi:hypothetical protein
MDFSKMHLDDLAIRTGTDPLDWLSPPPSIGIGSTSATWATSPVTVAQNSILALNGDDADIRINGVSLTGVLKNIEQRLNILRPNTELEAEWDQLRELGDQYRRLEAELKEKSLMWNKLNAIPPTID